MKRNPLEVLAPCPFCGAANALACELDTVPKSYTVICQECAAQGPTSLEEFAGAVSEWAQRDEVDEQTADDFGAESDEDLEDEVLGRPAVLARIVASGMLGIAVRELLEAGIPLDAIITLVSVSGERE